ncbi:hypothetical protein [Saccharothrix deserti]|uniref:hypothetical protein n=1 Tax=Saccharothrix deserti TaxID=2593674 RepID=UPI00131B98DF|nr:hypothetical protein [Saccharothrix deserti]
MNQQELLFSARLSSVNSLLGRYIARLMNEADPLSRTEYTVPLAEVEQEVGTELAKLAHAILNKAAGPSLEASSHL